MRDISRVAIIIPLSPFECEWTHLLSDLKNLPSNWEIILVGPKEPTPNLSEIVHDFKIASSIRWIHSELGRARQMNAAVQATDKEILWFLHADSRVGADAIRAVEEQAPRSCDTLFYFDLKFQDDGPILTYLNSIGVWIRSHLMKIPFGDQGFFIGRKLFVSLGGFPENVTYGEDHLLVWRARQGGVPIICAGGSIKTSARKYHKQGWLRTTLQHGIMTYRQALPEWLRTLRQEKL